MKIFLKSLRHLRGFQLCRQNIPSTSGSNGEGPVPKSEPCWRDDIITAVWRVERVLGDNVGCDREEPSHVYSLLRRSSNPDVVS